MDKKPEIIHDINDKIMAFKPMQDINMDSRVHMGLNSLFLQMRQEAFNLGRMHLKARREKMRNLLIKDFLQEEKELREVALAYINTQR